MSREPSSVIHESKISKASEFKARKNLATLPSFKDREIEREKERERAYDKSLINKNWLESRTSDDIIIKQEPPSNVTNINDVKKIWW